MRRLKAVSLFTGAGGLDYGFEAAGFRIARAPRALVHWKLQPSLWKTFRRFVVYARNNIRAGLWRNWQASIFLWYTLIFVLLTTIVFVGWWGFLAAVLFWICLMMARAMKSIYRNRRSRPAGLIRNSARLFMIVLVLASSLAAASVNFSNAATPDSNQKAEPHAGSGARQSWLAYASDWIEQHRRTHPPIRERREALEAILRANSRDQNNDGAA